MSIVSANAPASSSSSMLGVATQAVNDIENLQAQLDLYENSLNQLKKELPIYLSKYTETSKSCKNLIKSLRNIASCESNPQLQSALFLSAVSYDNIDKELVKLSATDNDLIALIDEMKRLAHAPFREILMDATQSRKALTEKTLINHVENSLTINHSFFEQYRVKYLKTLIEKHLQAELRYHCKAVEEFSTVLQGLDNIK